MTSALGVLLVAGLVTALPAAGQSLAEVARQEEARRKAIKTPGKVYTNDSIRAEPAPARPAPPREAASSAPAAAPADTPAVSPAAPALTAGPPVLEEPGVQKDQAYWKRRIDGAREALRRAEIFAEALQSRINGLTADFTARDDPAQRAVIAADRQKALAELDRVRQEIQEHTKAIAAIQEEARRAAVPPGWLR